MQREKNNESHKIKTKQNTQNIQEPRDFIKSCTICLMRKAAGEQDGKIFKERIHKIF